MYLRGNELILRPPPCEDAWLEICYEGGYPLDGDECFTGLKPELADLVLLKAQAIAYRNPKMLLDLAGYSTSTTNSSGAGSTGATDEVTTVVKEKSCGKETTTTTKKAATSSSSSSSLSNLSSINWTTLATQFETAYQKALLLRTESTTLPLRRNGYRARIH
jgi:hypothetical protein